MVIDSGRCIYQGPARDARQYFVDLGFKAPDRQTTADFLIAVTDPNERQFREICEANAPKTPEELEQAFKPSRFQRLVKDDITSYEAPRVISGKPTTPMHENSNRPSEKESRELCLRSPATSSASSGRPSPAPSVSSGSCLAVRRRSTQRSSSSSATAS